MIKRTFILILILIISLFATTGCYDDVKIYKEFNLEFALYDDMRQELSKDPKTGEYYNTYLIESDRKYEKGVYIKLYAVVKDYREPDGLKKMCIASKAPFFFYSDILENSNASVYHGGRNEWFFNYEIYQRDVNGSKQILKELPLKDFNNYHIKYTFNSSKLETDEDGYVLVHHLGRFKHELICEKLEEMPDFIDIGFEAIVL